MKAKLKELDTLRNIFWYTVLGLFALVMVYAYLVNKTVHNVAQRETIEREISQLTSTLSELEFNYIAKKNNINPEFAYSLGFKDVQNQKFVSRKVELGSLSLKTAQ